MEQKDNLQVKITESERIINRRILIIREQKVMIDADLAELYGVSTKRFNEQVKRNLDRFPDDFMFQLTSQEKDEVVANCDHLNKLKFSHSLPYAFTEHGVAMLSSILNSKQAILMNIFIVRAFIKMRESLDNYRELAIKIGEIELRQVQDHSTIKNVHEVVKHLLHKPDIPKNRIGFNE
jgi:hypothetical protein